MSKNRIDLRDAADDIGSVLLSEAELLMEHGAEHRALAFDTSQGGVWTSPAWTVVTLYYWAFFSALAITRLLGETVWFLNADAARALSTLATSGAKVAVGAYRMTVNPGATIGEVSVTLRLSKDRLHEAVWKRVHAQLDIALQAADDDSNQDEYRLLAAMNSCSKRLGEDWPSTVRNHVNYRPGFAYREVRRKGNPDAVQFLRRYPRPSWRTALDELEAAAASVNRKDRLEDPSAELGRLLASYVCLLHGFASDLYDEVSSRSERAGEWRRAHLAFLTERGVVSGARHWPLTEAD